MKLSTKAKPTAPPEVVLPGGEIVDGADADWLIREYVRWDERYRMAGAARRQLAYALERLTKGEAKTRRVEGLKYRAKVELPADSYNQGKLRSAWNAYPKLRDRLLRIESLGVRKRELAKLVATAGPADLEQFTRMVAEANDGPRGTPRITVERATEGPQHGTD